MQTPQKLYLLIENIFSFIEIFKFLDQSNVTISEFGLIGGSIRITIQYPMKTISCPLYIIVWEAPDKQ